MNPYTQDDEDMTYEPPAEQEDLFEEWLSEWVRYSSDNVKSFGIAFTRNESETLSALKAERNAYQKVLDKYREFKK